MRSCVSITFAGGHMDKVTTVRKYIKREEWKTFIRECHASGMTVRAWCESNGIKEQTYYRNLKKLREELVESLPAPIQEQKKPAIFQKLEVQAPIPTDQGSHYTSKKYAKFCEEFGITQSK